jgi:DNA-directed RNA polymerase specialized sigma24 family protein
MTLAPLPFDLEHDLQTTPALTPEELFDVADYAMRVVLRAYHYSWEDREDARQAAALHVWTAYQRHNDKGRDYFFSAARYGIYQWLNARRNFRHDASADDLEWVLASPAPEVYTRQIDDTALDTVKCDFDLTEQEMTYIGHLLDGLSRAVIIRTMGISERTFYRLRTRIAAKVQYEGG